MRIGAVVAACVLSILASASGSARADSDRDAVLAVVRQLFDGMRARDAAAIRALFHPSAQLFSSSVRDGTPVITVVPIDTFVNAVGRPGTELNDERTRNEIVHIDGTFASVWAEYAFYRGTTFSHCGVDAFQLAKDAHGWKIVSVGDTRRTDGCEGWPK
jgi:hypothetical protein